MVWESGPKGFPPYTGQHQPSTINVAYPRALAEEGPHFAAGSPNQPTIGVGRIVPYPPY